MHNDGAFSTRVEAAVRQIEASTDAEVVVVAAPHSGTYRDVVFAAASVFAFGAMNLAFFLPFSFHPVALSIELAATWAIGAWLFSGPRVLRQLVSPARRSRQVREAAFAEFHREAVHATPRRIGVLVYVSALEQAVLVLPDVGLEALLPGGRWAEAHARFDARTVDGILAGLAAIGSLLAETLPPTHEGPGLELADAPRIRT